MHAPVFTSLQEDTSSFLTMTANDGANISFDHSNTDEVASAAYLSIPPTDIEADGLSSDQLEQIWSWNSPVPPTLETCMHDLIRDEGRKEPNRLAIHSWDGDFTYNQVDTLSDSCAEILITAGVTTGNIVPLCFEKSRWTIIAVLAVMKAGGTFALMDPSQPEGRLRTIIEQTGARVLVTSKLQADLGTEITTNQTHLILTQQLLDENPTSPDLPMVSPGTDLYIQFTSGSTGKPKGVVITHTNYTSGAVPRADAVGYKSHSRVLDFASYAFDVCIDCMLCTLSAGGCLCIPSDADRVNDLSGAIRKMNINMAHMTPSVARVLEPDIIPSLEVLGLGGEAISAGDAANWSRSTKVINAYGPSECTVGCAINSDVGAESHKSNISIGRGVGASLWIVQSSDYNQLVPIGEVGELLVEGPIVGPGYLNEPQKTKEAFIDDPKWLTDGSRLYQGRKGRLYRTGDLVRHNEDGTIVFVGRGDQQVKLRGQRIELAEIEYNMRNKLPPGTRVVAEVITPRGSSSEKTLVAFVAEQAGLVADTEILLGSHSSHIQDALVDLDSHLSKDLPIYMIPAVYIPLQVMPLLVSAKTDRKRLRELGSSLSRKDISSFAAATVPQRKPSTDMEIKLADVWCTLLDLDTDPSAHDNFFAVGGDSLRAMKLVAQARASEVALTVADIFRNPILSDMALVARISSKQTRSEIPVFSLLGNQWTESAARLECAALCNIDPGLIEDIYPCTPLQEGLMALSAKISEAYVAQRVVKLPDELKARELLSAFRKASKDCPIMRTRIVQVPDHGLMQVVVKDDFASKWKTQQTQSEYLEEDRQISVGLGTPLVRYGVICNDPDSGKAHFILTMHHALYDGWSMPLIIDRVNRAHKNLATIRPADFKSFIDYICKMDRAKSEDYWRTRLEGAVSEQFPSLPWPGYQQQADSLLEHYVKTGRLATGTTIATVIRGAWALLVSKYTASNDIVFGETLTGRNAPIPGVEEIEGPMIATIPVRIPVVPEVTVSEYLREIQDQSVAGIPHEHFGLQHIRRLSPDAREACELRTGLVIHPQTEQKVTEFDLKQPADSFVPAGDVEAAQEALKFNTYALMLVCSLDPNGFLIMASFDSKTVSSPLMQRILDQLGSLVTQFIRNEKMKCGEVELLSDEDIVELRRLSQIGHEAIISSALLPPESVISETWIVDPTDAKRLLPLGAVGELLVRSTNKLPLDPVPEPSNSDETSIGTLFQTKRLAKYDNNGILSLIEEQPQQVVGNTSNQKRVTATSTKQKALRQIWSKILSISEEDIGLNESFFLLGGDSIGCMKIVSELRAQGMELTVPELFKHRTLYEMARVIKESNTPSESVGMNQVSFSLLGKEDTNAFVSDIIKPLLFQRDLTVQDVIPTRPLQQVAVNGTTKLPRYSARYELFHFSGAVNKAKLFKSCKELVNRNEILRTLFVEVGGECYSVICKSLEVPIDEYKIEGDIDSFCHKLCDVDVQTKMPLGAPFVNFLYVEVGDGDQSCLLLRISHAQYDEICLTGLLRQLAALYEERQTYDFIPFSSFVYHVAQKSIPQSVPYWRELLRDSSLTVLRPVLPLTSKTPAALTRTVDIASRVRDITIATLPTAAWALCLARRLGLRDVVFGEVVSGRSIDLPNADTVMGPTWQYVPVRVKFEDSWTGADLLEYVQYQHIASAQHEAMGLIEIARDCCPDWPATTDWFDSVVHQDVYHVEELAFDSTACRLETVYPHLEPLREWKVQAFAKGDGLTLELVTFKDWIGVASELLDELEQILDVLVKQPSKLLF
ncbi:peptide synthetase [Xylariaceae sp. FL0255]|nr:peptide synthetase [Xylariaceae sp. FL0255]